MSRRYTREIDLFWGSNGDFTLGENGDLRDTHDLTARAFIQRVLTRLEARKGDWALEEEVGADLTDFAGRPNTREVGSEIEARITGELTRGGFVQAEDLQVAVFPVGPRAVGVIIQIASADTGGQITLTFSYSLKDNKLIPRNL